MTQTRLEHVTRDRDDYTAKTGGKPVAITTEQCLHKASDEDAWYTAIDGKPYTVNFSNGDTCKVLSFKEVKQRSSGTGKREK
jgi:hypothetical protein